MKKVAGRLRLDLAQYRELEAFAQFGSDLDKATQEALTRGERMVATLNQPQYDPWPTEEQVVAIYAGINGYLDDVPAAQVARFQDELREHLRTEGKIYKAIAKTKDLADDLTARLEAELDKFVKGFNVQQDTGLVGRPRASDRVATVQDISAPGQVGPQHAQDHQGDGARRRREAPPRAAAHRGDAPVRRPDARADGGDRPLELVAARPAAA